MFESRHHLPYTRYINADIVRSSYFEKRSCLVSL